MRPSVLCSSLRPGLFFFRGEFEGKGVEAFAYMDDTALGLVGGTEKYGESQTLPSACS